MFEKLRTSQLKLLQELLIAHRSCRETLQFLQAQAIAWKEGLELKPIGCIKARPKMIKFKGFPKTDGRPHYQPYKYQTSHA